MTDVTRILCRIESGESGASAELLPLIYDELRRLAALHLSTESAGHSLQATALVHEAYIRLVDSSGGAKRWDSRGHFYSAAAKGMRRILVESARRKNSQKRGGKLRRVDIEVDGLVATGRERDLIALDEALGRLAEKHNRKARLVDLRYFAGLRMDEAAQALNISLATAERDWRFARAWLHRELTRDLPDSS